VRRQTAIVGIGQAGLSKAADGEPWDLAIAAVNAALEDAGIDASEVDGLIRYISPFETVTQPMMAAALGLDEVRYLCDLPMGGEASAASIVHAAAAIISGQADVVVVYRSIKQSGGVRYGRAFGGGSADDAGNTPVSDQDNRAYAWPYGVIAPAQIFALWATRYMHEANLSFEQLSEALGTISITQRAYARNNPHAIMGQRPMTREDYDGARMISWPLRLFDMCIENDGACAVVLVSAERAERLDAQPAYVLAATQSLTPYGEPMGQLYAEDYLRIAHPAAIERLYSTAGIGPQDISVAAFYDASNFFTLRTLELYGFADRWKAAQYLSEHGIGLDSPLPVNTHGGHLSEGYIHGMTGILEAVRQLRGSAYNQVDDVKHSLYATITGHAVVLGR
jgi:acetyl-CoA acetyltransferase